MGLPSRRLLAGVYIACGLLAGSVSFALGQSKNLEVFRHASRALLAGRDLYDGSSVDWFKYSPTFALLFLPFAVMPAWLAAPLWGALNFGASFIGIDAASRAGAAPHALETSTRSRVTLLAALPGILLATDGDQANLLVAGTMLLAFAAFERNHLTRGASAVALGALVKVFPIAASLFALLHRDRERSVLRVLLVLVLGGALPVVVLGSGQLGEEYRSWLALLRTDHATRGWSLVTVVRDLGGTTLHVQLFACVMLLVPVLASLVAPTNARFRRAFAASMLVLIVLSNHRSEYTSFVLSAIGVALWFADGLATTPRIALLVLASLAHGPFFVRDDPALGGPFAFLAAHRLFHPLRLVPLVVVWLLLQRSLASFVGERIAQRAAGRPSRENAAE